MKSRRTSLKIGPKIVASSIFAFFVVFAFFPPAILERLSSVFDDLQRYVQLLVIGILLFGLLLKRKIKISQSNIRWAVYCLFGFTLTLIMEPESVYPFLMRVGIPVFMAVLLCVYYKNKPGGMQQLMDVMYYYWVVLIVLNCAVMVLFPSGIIRSTSGSNTERANWLLGSKNNVVLPLLFASAIFLNRYLQAGKRRHLKFIAFFAAVFFNLMWAGSNGVGAFNGSSTGLLALLTLLAMYFIGYFPIRKYLMCFSAGWYAFAFLLLSAVVIIGSTSGNALIGAIFGAVGKDATASQRTYIWVDAISYVMQAPVFGRGYTTSITLGTNFGQTYNMFLDCLYRYGIIGLILLIFSFGSYKVKNDQEDKMSMMPKYALLAGVVAMFVCSLVNSISLEYIIVLLEMYASTQTQSEHGQKEIWV